MHFKAYNLIFKSSLDLKDYGFLKVKKQAHDIEIIVKRDNCTLPKDQYFIDSQESYYYVKDKVFFRVTNGRLIEVYPQIKDKEQIKQFVVNFPIALCLSQQSKLVLHASAVQKNEIMLVFCGKSNAGKSTLAYQFKQKSWKIISEDIFVFDFETGEVEPSPPFIKLSKQACKEFNLDFEDSISGNRGDRKFFSREKEKIDNCIIKHCFFLNWGNLNKIEKISHESALKELYKYAFISSDQISAKKILKTLKHFSFKKLTINKNLSKIQDVYEKVLKML